MEVNDLVLVYEETTPLLHEGAVAKILDKSGDDPNTILVAKLEDIGEVEYKFRHDVNAVPIILMTEKSVWVDKKNCKLLKLKKPGFFGRLFG